MQTWHLWEREQHGHHRSATAEAATTAAAKATAASTAGSSVTVGRRHLAFERIAEGLNEALSVARGDTKPAKLHVPAEIDVRAIRAKLHVSQEEGFTINQIKDWEQGRARPIKGVRAYLMLIKQDPKAIHNLLHAAIGGTVRKRP
jgi:putative transcriptional regulator